MKYVGDNRISGNWNFKAPYPSHRNGRLNRLQLHAALCHLHSIPIWWWLCRKLRPAGEAVLRWVSKYLILSSRLPASFKNS